MNWAIERKNEIFSATKFEIFSTLSLLPGGGGGSIKSAEVPSSSPLHATNRLCNFYYCILLLSLMASGVSSFFWPRTHDRGSYLNVTVT